MSTETNSGPIVFYDGSCGFCQRSVQWLLRHDRRQNLRFAPLQGATARALLPSDLRGSQPGSLVMWQDGKPLLRSTAALRCAQSLGGHWAALGQLGMWVPRPLRDGVYNLVARNRYRLGGSSACLLPTPEQRLRFLD